MHPATQKAFFDELEKIAAKPMTQPPFQGAPETQMYTNAATAPNPRDQGNGDWRQKGGKRMFMSSPAEKTGPGTPARLANNLFGLPFNADGRFNDIRGLRRYDDQSEAKSQDRSQSPIDAQSTANLSQGGAMYPASGPGGV